MLSFLRRRKPAVKSVEFSAPLQSETLIYAIGDVHGRADLLTLLLARIDSEIEAHDGPAEVVFLGDYVDRGEHSREVLDLLVERVEQERPAVLLKGNHEQMLLDFLERPRRGRRWLRYGGLQTLSSYGVGDLRALSEGADLSPVRDRLAEAMGPHADFLGRLALTHRNGNVLCVHAAADPVVAPDEQAPEALLWGCESFTTQAREDGLWVVHGHTVVSEPRSSNGRIAVDTGAYFSGRLTAARIDGGELEFLTA